MNASAIKGIRTLHEDLTSATRTKTARDMALTPHNCNRTGEIATTQDGQKWVWVDHLRLWVAYN